MLEGLTERQADALKLLANGATNKEIAARLGMSLPATKKQIRLIYQKLGVANRSEATRAWLERFAHEE